MLLLLLLILLLVKDTLKRPVTSKGEAPTEKRNKSKDGNTPTGYHNHPPPLRPFSSLPPVQQQLRSGPSALSYSPSVSCPASPADEGLPYKGLRSGSHYCLTR